MYQLWIGAFSRPVDHVAYDMGAGHVRRGQVEMTAGNPCHSGEPVGEFTPRHGTPLGDLPVLGTVDDGDPGQERIPGESAVTIGQPVVVADGGQVDFPQPGVAEHLTVPGIQPYQIPQHVVLGEISHIGWWTGQGGVMTRDHQQPGWPSQTGQLHRRLIGHQGAEGVAEKSQFLRPWGQCVSRFPGDLRDAVRKRNLQTLFPARVHHTDDPVFRELVGPVPVEPGAATRVREHHYRAGGGRVPTAEVLEQTHGRFPEAVSSDPILRGDAS